LFLFLNDDLMDVTCLRVVIDFSSMSLDILHEIQNYIEYFLWFML